MVLNIPRKGQSFLVGELEEDRAISVLDLNWEPCALSSVSSSLLRASP